MFPPDQLTEMFEMTSELLRKNISKPTIKVDIVKWMGILILMTRTMYRGCRSKLWDTMSEYTLLLAHEFKKTVMILHLFEQLRSCVRWSNQDVHRPEGMSHAKHCWQLVQDFVDRFNYHRSANFVPSDILCADDSMSKRNGMGVLWINIGFP